MSYFGQNNGGADMYTSRIYQLLDNVVLPTLVQQGQMNPQELPAVRDAIFNRGVLNGTIGTLLQQVQLVDAYGNVTYGPVQRPDNEIISIVMPKVIAIVQNGRMVAQRSMQGITGMPHGNGMPGFGFGQGGMGNGSIFMNNNTQGNAWGGYNGSIFANQAVPGVGMNMMSQTGTALDALSMYDPASPPPQTVAVPGAAPTTFAPVHQFSPATPVHEQNTTVGLSIYEGNDTQIAARGVRPMDRPEVRSSSGSRVETTRAEPAAVTNAEFEAQLATNSVQFSTAVELPDGEKPSFLLGLTSKLERTETNNHLINTLTVPGLMKCSDVEIYRTGHSQTDRLIVTQLHAEDVYKSWNDCKYDLYHAKRSPRLDAYPMYLNKIAYKEVHTVKVPRSKALSALASLTEYFNFIKSDGTGVYKFIEAIRNIDEPLLRHTYERLFIEAFNALALTYLTVGGISITVDCFDDLGVFLNPTDHPDGAAIAHLTSQKEWRVPYIKCLVGAAVTLMSGKNYLDSEMTDDAFKMIELGSIGLEVDGLTGSALIRHMVSNNLDPASHEAVKSHLSEFFSILITRNVIHSKISPSDETLRLGIHSTHTPTNVESELDVIMVDVLTDANTPKNVLPLYLDINENTDSGVAGVYSVGPSFFGHLTYARVEG